VLTSIDVQLADARGISDTGTVAYDFVSPSRMAAKPSGTCGVRVLREPFRSYVRERRGEAYGVPLTTAPSCSIVNVWEEAIRKGAPSNARATIRLEMRQHESRLVPLWRFSISDDDKVIFNMDLVDSCPTHPPS